MGERQAFKEIAPFSTTRDRIHMVYDFFQRHHCTEFVFVGFSGNGKNKRVVINVDTLKHGIETIAILDKVEEKLLVGKAIQTDPKE